MAPLASKPKLAEVLLIGAPNPPNPPSNMKLSEIVVVPVWAGLPMLVISNWSSPQPAKPSVLIPAFTSVALVEAPTRPCCTMAAAEPTASKSPQVAPTLPRRRC